MFLINLPVLAIGLIGGYFFIQDSRDEHPRRVDLVGYLLSIAGLFALVYGIIEAGQTSWTEPKVLYAFGAAGGFFYLFGVAEVDTGYGMVVIGKYGTSLGMGLTMSPATNSVMGSLPVDKAGIGSAMNDTTRMLGAHIIAGKVASGEIPGIDPALAGTITESANQAFVSGMARAMLVGGIIMAVTSVLSFLIVPTRVQPAREEAPAAPGRALP